MPQLINARLSKHTGEKPYMSFALTSCAKHGPHLFYADDQALIGASCVLCVLLAKYEQFPEFRPISYYGINCKPVTTIIEKKVKRTCLKTELGIPYHASQIRENRVEKRDESEERNEHGSNIGDQGDGCACSLCGGFDHISFLSAEVNK